VCLGNTNSIFATAAIDFTSYARRGTYITALQLYLYVVGYSLQVYYIVRSGSVGVFVNAVLRVTAGDESFSVQNFSNLRWWEANIFFFYSAENKSLFNETLFLSAARFYNI